MTDQAPAASSADARPALEVPAEIREAARTAPDHWFGMVDPAWRGDSTPPDWAVVGRYRSDSDGEVVEWQYNDDYRPSPRANGWPDPSDAVDDAIQLAATGYGSEHDVHRLLADAEVLVLLAPGGGPAQMCRPDGAPVVPVFTSEAQLRAGGRYASRTVLVQDLVRDLAEGTQLYVNPAGAVSMSFAPEVLEPAAEEAAAEPTDEAATEADTEATQETASAPLAAATGRDRGRPMDTLKLPEPEPETERALPVAEEGRAARLSPEEYLVSILSGDSDQ